MGQARLRHQLLVINITLSAVVPIGLALVTSATVQISLLVGLVGLVLTMQVESYLKAEERQGSELIRSRLTEALNNDKEFGAQLTAIAENVGSVLSAGLPKTYVNIARSEFERVQRLLNGLRRETLELTGIVDSLRDADTVTRSYKAVSMLEPELAWWTSSDGIDWLNANSRWIDQNNAQVERIFIYTDGWNESNEAIVQQHLAKGIQVKKVHHTLLPSRLRRNVGIFDDLMIMEFFGWGNPDRIERVVYSAEASRVEEAIKEFEQSAALRNLASGRPKRQ